MESKYRQQPPDAVAGDEPSLKPIASQVCFRLLLSVGLCRFVWVPV